MHVPRQGDPLCPTGAVVLVGRGGAIRRENPHSRWVAGTCTWCGGPLPKGRRSWCSDACVDAFKLTTEDGQHVAVERRDGGRCTLCGLDTHRFRWAVRRWVGLLERRGRASATHVAHVLTLRGLPTSPGVLRHLLHERVVWWDRDHTVPIVDGGHPVDIANQRTLCWWCHKRETAEAATRRAEARKLPPAPPPPVPQLALFEAG